MICYCAEDITDKKEKKPEQTEAGKGLPGLIWFCVSAAVIILDRIVKYVVHSGMAPGQSIPVIEDIFHITYVRNQGAAFSLWEQEWVILIGLPALALAAGFVLLYVKRMKWNRWMLMSVAFICGGGAGNLIDRICSGYVVDMFDCRFIPFMDFPVFNIADIFICAGCGLLLLDVVFLEGREEKSER